MAENSLAVPILVGIEERRFLLAEQLPGNQHLAFSASGDNALF